MSFDWLMGMLKASPALIPLVLFVVALGEAIVFTSPFVPATVLLLGLGGLHQAVGGSFATIAVAAALGTFIGDSISYTIGRVYRDSIGGWWPFKDNPGWLPAAIAYTRRWGAFGLVGSKFLGPLRWFGPTICGMLTMPILQFLLVTVVASTVWSVVLLSPSYYGAQAISR